MINTISIAVCDDHTLFRKSLQIALNSFSRINYCIDSSNGQELLDEFERGAVPCIALVDLKMPVMDGYQTIKCIKSKFPAIKTIAMSSFDNEFSIKKTFKSGADAFISKNDNLEDIYGAIIDLADNGIHINKWANINLSNDILIDCLTPKEKEVLKLLCRDLSYHQIADEMYISIKTVDRHRDEIFKKLKVQSRTSLVIFALTNGIF
ncbi:MAG: hypothetical protein C0459_14895 [Chitinophaga sp.]|jgi:two-component system, NarL family, invasion response regulator UvrY|nr:hypothetical protein [Chitinophaga sp.]